MDFFLGDRDDFGREGWAAVSFILEAEDDFLNHLKQLLHFRMNVKISPDETVPKAKGLRELVFPLAYFMDECKVEDQAVIDRLKTILEKRQQ